MAQVFRVRDWNTYYENNRTRVIENLRYVAIQNSHDGESYSRLMMREDAPEIFTAWILLLQVASKCHPRGTLLTSTGAPHDAESLAIKTRGQKTWFKKAFPILLSLGWIEAVDSELLVTQTSHERQVCDVKVRKEGIYRRGLDGKPAQAGTQVPKDQKRNKCHVCGERLSAEDWGKHMDVHRKERAAGAA